MPKPNYGVLLKESRLIKTTCKEYKVKVKPVNITLRR